MHDVLPSFFLNASAKAQSSCFNTLWGTRFNPCDLIQVSARQAWLFSPNCQFGSTQMFVFKSGFPIHKYRLKYYQREMSL
jgi:hypothetical protein